MAGLVPASTYTIADQQRMARAARYFAWQGRLAAPYLTPRVLEVGCGLGNFTGTLLGRQCVVAIDADPACIARLRERYPNQPNLHAFACDAGSPKFTALARFCPDSCVCFNVLEHIAGDRAALEAMAAVLVPGAPIVLLAPAFPALYGPIDRRLGHHRRYTRTSLQSLARAAGLHVEKLHYVNAPGMFAWWINGRVLGRETQSERQIALFDRCVPLLARLEFLRPPPFGLSLFAVLRTP
jgi:SAM-dependent methyltransferase